MRPTSHADTAAAALAELQSRFLASLRDADVPGEGVDRDLFVDPPAGTLAERWAIYRNAYLVRLTEAIADRYPAIARIAGPVPFRDLCQRYVTEFPPSSHDIGRAGARFPEYLPSDPIATSLPFLPDLARFERALAEAVAAPDVEPLRWRDLAAMPADRLAEIPLRLACAAALIVSPWPLTALWLTTDQPDSAVDVDLAAGPSAILVARQGLEPRWRSLDADELAVAEAVSRGATPASILESDALGGGRDAPPRFVRALRSLVSFGALAPLSVSGSAPGAPPSKETS